MKSCLIIGALIAVLGLSLIIWPAKRSTYTPTGSPYNPTYYPSGGGGGHGRCTGSFPCAACTTCSSCIYCSKNGGSCGTCRGARR